MAAPLLTYRVADWLVGPMARPTAPLLKSRAFLISVAGLIFISAESSLAQQQLASYELPTAPTPEIRAVILTRPPAAPRLPEHRRLTLNNISLAVLFGSEALDSWTTYRNLTHPKWICGYSPALGNAVTYISDDGKRYDPRTIQYNLCGPSPSGQLANYAYDVTRAGAFTETGWVTSFRLTGTRNVAGVLAWNFADDVGQMLIARHLAKRRGFIGRIAPAINFARGLVHIDCGIQNLQFARHHNNPSAWNFNLPNEANLYPTPRWWGRR
jgi:hypothetical protein